jgi:hypothetical protein
MITVDRFITDIGVVADYTQQSRIQGSGFSTQGSGYSTQGSGYSTHAPVIQGSGYSTQGSGYTNKFQLYRSQDIDT